MINKEILMYIVTQPDETAVEILRSIFDSLYNYDLNKSLKERNLLSEVRNIITTEGIDKVKIIESKIIALLKRSAKTGKENEEIDNNKQGVEDKLDIEADVTQSSESRANQIETTDWLSETEKQALFRVEDPAFQTPNLDDITDKAKWQYYSLASAKLRVLKALNIPI